MDNNEYLKTRSNHRLFHPYSLSPERHREQGGPGNMSGWSTTVTTVTTAVAAPLNPPLTSVTTECSRTRQAEVLEPYLDIPGAKPSRALPPHWLNTDAHLLIRTLNQYLSQEEQEILESETRKPHHGDKLQQLLEQEWHSPLMSEPQTCNTLYWGLYHKIITPERFLEFYSLLTLNLTFLSHCQSIPDFENLPVVATDISITDTPEGWQHTIAFTNTMKEIQKTYSRSELDGKGEQNRLAALFFWLGVLDGDGLIAVDKEGVVIIPPIKTILAKAKNKAEIPQTALQPILTFGAGDWEDLKSMRKKGCHPVALWHPDLNGTPLRFGTLT